MSKSASFTVFFLANWLDQFMITWVPSRAFMDKSKDHSDSARRVVIIEKIFFFLVSDAGGSEKNAEYSTEVEPIAFWPQLFKQWIALSTGLYILSIILSSG